jgi:hypothetical protein
MISHLLLQFGLLWHGLTDLAGAVLLDDRRGKNIGRMI